MSQIEFELTRRGKLLQYANNKRNDGDFNDVNILAGAESVSANRMVLACYSKFFESMFCSSLKERYQNTVEIKNFDGKAVKQVIDYMYTGIININANNVLTLLGTADFLQVDEVTKMCFDFMETSLTVDSCLNVVKASVLYNYPYVQQTYKYISDNFDEIVLENNFKQQSRNELLSLFTNINRNTVQEMSLYTAVIHWIKHDENREAEFSSLFRSLDLEKFPSDFVADTIAEEPLVKDSKECLNAVVSFLVKNMRDIKKNSKTSKIICVGGDKSKSVLEIYSISGDLLKTYPDLPWNLSNHCVLNVDRFIYCLGGAVDGFHRNTTNKVYRLNLKTPKSGWEEVASMAEKRCDFGAAVFKGCLVVAGGWNGSSPISTAELYEPHLNKWKTSASLLRKRCEHVLVVQEEKLFAIGGRLEGKGSSSMEKLDGLEDKWKETEPMNEKRRWFAAVACHNYIYAIDGINIDSRTKHKSVEKYDVKQNNWGFVRGMNVERYDHAACVLNKKIFVVGGTDANDEVIKTIECYDPTIDQWITVAKTKQELWRHAIVAV